MGGSVEAGPSPLKPNLTARRSGGQSQSGRDSIRRQEERPPALFDNARKTVGRRKSCAESFKEPLRQKSNGWGRGRRRAEQALAIAKCDDVYVSSPAPVLMTTMGGTVTNPLQSTCSVSASSETRDSSLSVHRESLQLSSPLHSLTRLLHSYHTNEIQLSQSSKRLPPSLRSA